MKVTKRYLKFLEDFKDLPQYDLVQFLRDLLRHENAEEIENIRHHYDASYVGVHPRREDLTLLPTVNVYVTVANRDALHSWAAKHNLAVPIECEKSCVLKSQDEPVTSLTYTFHVWEGFKVEVTYTRSGLPSSKCKIVESMTKTVECEFDNSDVPF